MHFMKQQELQRLFFQQKILHLQNFTKNGAQWASGIKKHLRLRKRN